MTIHPNNPISKTCNGKSFMIYKKLYNKRLVKGQNVKIFLNL
jgi:hypothetical protein